MKRSHVVIVAIVVVALIGGGIVFAVGWERGSARYEAPIAQLVRAIEANDAAAMEDLTGPPARGEMGNVAPLLAARMRNQLGAFERADITEMVVRSDSEIASGMNIGARLTFARGSTTGVFVFVEDAGVHRIVGLQIELPEPPKVPERLDEARLVAEARAALSALLAGDWATTRRSFTGLGDADMTPEGFAEKLGPVQAECRDADMSGPTTVERTDEMVTVVFSGPLPGGRCVARLSFGMGTGALALSGVNLKAVPDGAAPAAP